MTEKRRGFDRYRRRRVVNGTVLGPLSCKINSTHAVKIHPSDPMREIYQSSLDEKFAAILAVIARELGAGGSLNGLTADGRADIENLAEQAIIDWAVASRGRPTKRRPLTNLEHLLSEYCALADHL